MNCDSIARQNSFLLIFFLSLFTFPLTSVHSGNKLHHPEDVVYIKSVILFPTSSANTMVFDALHQSIIQMEWDDAEATLATDAGRDMAKDYFKEDLPLHMACERKAPDSTILALLESHREAAAVPGRYGGYPLHLAAQQKLSPNVLVHLIRAYPEALDLQDDAKNFPRDYEQRNDLSREALSRPAPCWVEDVEKEEYLERVAKKRMQLRQKIVQLKTSLGVSKQRRDRMFLAIQELEPRLAAQRDEFGRLNDLEKQMMEIYESNKSKIESVQQRIKTLSDELSKVPEEEELMMRSLMRRTYMQGEFSSIYLIFGWFFFSRS